MIKFAHFGRYVPYMVCFFFVVPSVPHLEQQFRLCVKTYGVVDQHVTGFYQTGRVYGPPDVLPVTPGYAYYLMSTCRQLFRKRLAYSPRSSCYCYLHLLLFKVGISTMGSFSNPRYDFTCSNLSW